MPLLRIGKRVIASRVSPTKFFGPSVSIIGILSVLFMFITGKINLASLDLGTVAGQLSSPDEPTTEIASTTVAPTITPVRLDRTTPRAEDRIRIATYNIQNFGKTKSADPNVMQVLASIVSSFDLVAIQEVQSPEAMPIAKLVDLINRSGGHYDATLGPPIGRTPSHKEQYAFVWDTTRIRLVPDSSFVVNDADDRMHREPMVASFETRVSAAQGRQPFRFTIISAHTDPDEVSAKAGNNELDVLDDVFIRVREYEYGAHREEDFLLVGDLNVDVAHLSELGQIPGIVSLAGNQPTNTAGTKNYDHILIDRNTTSEFTGRAGVIDYQRDFGLTAEQAVTVSDHRPVWAEFGMYEIPAFANIAQQPQPGMSPQR